MFMSETGIFSRLLRPRARPQAPLAVRRIDGLIEELSPTHVAGWMRDPADPAARLAYQVVCTRTGDVLASGVADQFRHDLEWRDIGDAACGFHARLPPGASATIEVRPAGGPPLARSPDLRTCFEPLLHVAMDIVDNCNLRCPFCLYDYTNTRTTHFMTPETLQSALALLPFVRDGQFWFSCLHEPTLHPQLTEFIDMVPAQYRKKLFYTTNLAKRMPDSYFDWLANSGIFNINVSIESRDPAIYERMRKGARHRIFQENWDKLLAAFARAPSPPHLRYIVLAYKSNIDELPELVTHLLEERRAWQVELRYTFDAPYIPGDFRSAEFLDAADWARVRAELPGYPTGRLVFVPPPDGPPPVRPAALAACQPDYYMFGLSWDGTLRVRGISGSSRRGDAIEQEIRVTNLADIGEPGAWIARLAAPGG